MTKIFFLMTFLLLGTFSSRSQNNDYPIVGKPCPEFLLKSVHHHPKSQVALNDFKGKWLILDFWTKSCSSCLASFPKINQLQKEFADDIQFLLVGKNDLKYNHNIEIIFERFRQHFNLDLAIAYDSALFDRFGVSSTPHVIVLRPDGVVYAVTNSSGLNTKILQELIEGEEPDFIKKKNLFEENSSVVQKSYATGLKDTDGVLHKSILSKWHPSEPIRIPSSIDQELEKCQYMGTSLSVDRLYNLAYVGLTDWGFGDSLYTKLWKYPIYECKDPLRYQENRYNYTLVFPKEKATRGYVQRAMQYDLQKYFEYVVTIERRMMPYWKLVAHKSARTLLETRKGHTDVQGDPTGVTLINVPLSKLLSIIWAYHQNAPPFIDETRITSNIDIQIEAPMTDLHAIRSSLQKYGLDLVSGTMEVKALIIRDKAGKIP